MPLLLLLQLFIYLFIYILRVCVFLHSENTDANRVAIDVFSGERTVAVTGHAQLPGRLRPVVQTVVVQRRRGRRAVGGEHHSVWRLISSRLVFNPPPPPGTGAS